MSSCQHLLLVLLLQAGHDVLLSQLHLAAERTQLRVQELLCHLNLGNTREGQEISSQAFVLSPSLGLQEKNKTLFSLNKLSK